MSQLPTLAIKSGKPSPHNGYTTVTATLHIPESGLTLTARTTGWGYNQSATVILHLMNQLSCPNDGLHYSTDTMRKTLFDWIALGNIRPRPTLPVLFKHATYHNTGCDPRTPHTTHYEIIALFPTLPANYGNILCYAHIGQHSECDYGFAIGHGTARLRNATISEYTPLLNELKSIYESDLDAYRLVVKTQLKLDDLVAMWKTSARK